MKPIFLKIARVVVAVVVMAMGGSTFAVADDNVAVAGALTAGAAGGDFVPFYQGSLAGGRFVSSGNVQLEAMAISGLNLDKRFSWAAGVDLIADFASGIDYGRYDGVTQQWTTTSIHPARARVQQLFGAVKWRGVFLEAGMKEVIPAMGHERLSSGDLVASGNACPIPGGRIGFIDFQNIPFTNGWVQIQGEVFYGKMLDSDWWSDFGNRFNRHIAGGEWYNYKRCYFRTKPSQPFSVTVGMQAAATFGGWTRFYTRGEVTRYDKRKVKAWDLARMLIPTPSASEDFYDGNHLGTWDLEARYRLKNGDCIKARFSWPWEDGSAIGRRNGWDGLWGIEYVAATTGNLLDAAVVEYIDMTNQSGPIHFAPGDRPGIDIPTEATGADDYYNNVYYNSYANYGLSIGSPMLMAPAFNIDGYTGYIGNRMRGVHIACEGRLSPRVGWMLKGGYRVAYGNAKIMLLKPIHLTAVMAEVTYRTPWINGLNVGASVELDNGTMPGSTFGAMVKVSYNTNFNLKKR
ncbi:MAG: hypothetical protein J1E63_03420 [Muribaculaceae bacterium]|nr:hypothetical protein [Muribaculaceae bacterium]